MSRLTTPVSGDRIASLYLEDERSNLEPSVYALIKGYLRSRAWIKLLDIDSQICKHSTLQTTRIISQIQAFFSKNADLAEEGRCKEAARKSFERAERLCRITNKRLDHFAAHEERLDEVVQKQVVTMRRVIADVMGESRDWLDRIPSLIKLTNGATSETVREKSLPYMKVRKSVACTAGAWPFVRTLCRLLTGGEPRRVDVRCNRIALVPKNVKTHRTIAAEPLGNLPFQLAVDAWIKERLLKLLGIGLRSQKRNQDMAREGSITGKYATIDLSMASDTLAYNVIAYLFPEAWWWILHQLRTPSYKGVFGNGDYAKFSSMGNGYTFTLETLVFSAACVAVGSRNYSVYGDDIIIESELYEPVVRLLRYLGFVPNLQKSFSAGPFRESCGADYYQGVSVRPFYIRSMPSGKPELAHLVNGLARVAKPEGRLWGYLRELSFENKLRFVPYNDSTESGVHIHPNDARSVGLLKPSTIERVGMEVFLGYERKPKRSRSWLRSGGVKGLILWHIRRMATTFDEDLSQDVPTGVGEHDSEVSWVQMPNDTVKVRSRVWHPPDRGIAPHMYAWSDYVLAMLKPVKVGKAWRRTG